MVSFSKVTMCFHVLTEVCNEEMFLKNNMIVDISATSSEGGQVSKDMLNIQNGTGWTPNNTDTPQTLTLQFVQDVLVGELELREKHLVGFRIAYGAANTNGEALTLYKEDGDVKVRIIAGVVRVLCMALLMLLVP